MNLHAAAKALAPSRLRFGGSGNDNLVYGLTPGSPSCDVINSSETECSYLTPGCLNASHWDSLWKFANASDAQFLFAAAFHITDACAMTKIGENSSFVWNATNLLKLLTYAVAHDQTLWGFELGNELNNQGGVPCNLTVTQQAEAIATLAPIASRMMPGAKLVGPDTGYRDAKAWLSEYLSRVAAANTGTTTSLPLIHAVTHHVYPGISRKGFNIPSALDSSNGEIKWYIDTIKKHAPRAEIWAGEDGPIGGGNSGTCGANSLCGTFASALWYADDMANRAQFGFKQYQRQDFFGGAYGLTASIGEHAQSALGVNEALLLRPGFWVNFLWKRLLGTGVLNVSVTDANIRAYAFTGDPPSPHSPSECSKTERNKHKAIAQLLLINLLEKTKHVTIVMPAAAAPRERSRATARLFSQGEKDLPVVNLMDKQRRVNFFSWSLTPSLNISTEPPSLAPFAKEAVLNGGKLHHTVNLQSANTAPAFLTNISAPGRTGNVADGIMLPPLSVSFVCLV